MAKAPALFQAIRKAADRVAIVDGRRRYTYGEVLSAALMVRDGLLRGGDDLEESRVAFLAPAGLDYVGTLLGIWAAGGIAVPLSPKHPLPELGYVIKDTAASRLIAAPEFESFATALSSGSEFRVQFTNDLLADRTSSAAAEADLPDIDGSRRAMILYTSGSTGRPKGVVTTHANIAAQIEALVEAWDWIGDDRILHVLPLHHVHGIVNALLCALRVGAVCEFAHPFQPELVWERIAGRELTLLMAVPTMYSKLLAAVEEASADTRERWREAARGMRLHVSGSAALPVPVLEKWESLTGQRLLERYGMTETGMILSNPYRGDRRPGFVGRPLSGVEVRRTDDLGRPVPDHEQGEIEVRGANVFLEYWNRPEETAASFRDGWFRTGDIAVVEDGDYRILGRKSVDLIKTGGYKVSALEIEDVLRSHPGISDCAVVGVPDEEWGERVAVCVVGDGTLNLASLRRWAKERLAPYKVPSLLCVRSQLPRNAMGKVQKRLVRELFRQSAAPEDSRESRDSDTG